MTISRAQIDESIDMQGGGDPIEEQIRGASSGTTR